MRGINAGNPKRVRWAHLARSGSQSKDRIHFTLSTGAASNVIFLFTTQNYMYVISINTYKLKPYFLDKPFAIFRQ